LVLTGGSAADPRRSGPPGRLRERAIAQDDLQEWLANRIKGAEAIVLADTCESGALIAGHKASRTDTPASEAPVGLLLEATGGPVLAVAAGQFAHGTLIAASGQRHGVFTWAVLDALRKGGINGNCLMELSDLVATCRAPSPKWRDRGAGGRAPPPNRFGGSRPLRTDRGRGLDNACRSWVAVKTSKEGQVRPVPRRSHHSRSPPASGPLHTNVITRRKITAKDLRFLSRTPGGATHTSCQKESSCGGRPRVPGEELCSKVADQAQG
jgi:hypothetical protein